MKVHTSLCTYFCQKSFYCNAKYLLYMTSFCPPTPLNLMSNPFWVCTLWFLCVCMNIYTYLYIYQSIDIILIQSYINLDLYHFIYTHITGYMCVCAHIHTLHIHYIHIYAHTYISYNHKHLLVVKGLFFNKISSISGFYFCSAILQEVNISTFNIKETIYIWKRAIGFLMKKLEKCIILQHYSKWFFFFSVKTL